MTLGDEQTLAVLVMLGMLGALVYLVVRWVMGAPRTMDPWGIETEEALNGEEAFPLCHHCLTPQEHNGWFCPECGTTVGPYSYYLPYVYLFAQGEVLRAGVNERLRRNLLITIGFILLPLTIFAVAAPFYWYFLFKNLRRGEPARAEPSSMSA